MTAAEIKTYIYENDLVEDILLELGCHHIKNKGNYWSCANPDGDNPNAIVIYKNENITTINYTRQIVAQNRTTDLLDLISYIRNCSFPESLKWICQLCSLDYYSEPEELPASLQIIQMLNGMKMASDEEEIIALKPINEKILDYYIYAGNVMFEDDGISLETQEEWEIGYDPQTNSITIPIRDEIGSLIGVKARKFKYTKDTPIEKVRFNDYLDDGESKYFFLSPCAKNQLLYGLYKNLPYIKRQGIVYVCEAEKSVMQLYEMGYYGVSIGGHQLSKRQVEMLIRLEVRICLCYDKDVPEEIVQAEADKFLEPIPIYYMYDSDGILDEKESPTDNPDKWKYLVANNIQRVR